MADIERLKNAIRARRTELSIDDNEMEQLEVYLEAFGIFMEREAKYLSLWKQHGAIDAYHHVTSKAARTQFYLEGQDDESDPIDLINYTVFLIRNMRAGRIHPNVEWRRDDIKRALERAIFLAKHMHSMITKEVWREHGADDGQGHYEGDYRSESVAAELDELELQTL